MEQTFREIRNHIRERILIMDGAMGTRIQAFGLTAENFHRGRFENWRVSLVGNNDVLCLTAPDVIKDIHRLYIEAGADILLMPQSYPEAFEGLPMDAVIVPDGCTIISSRAFADCENLIYARIPADASDIADDAFEGSDQAVLDRD